MFRRKCLEKNTGKKDYLNVSTEKQSEIIMVMFEGNCSYEHYSNLRKNIEKNLIEECGERGYEINDKEVRLND